MKVVLIIPTFNEAGNVKSVVEALAKVFRTIPDHDLQILFVDDSSPDGTAAAIRQLIFKYKFVHILMNKRKGGLGHAYKKGMVYALDKMKADVVFEFDADLSHDPTKIPEMIQAIEKGADMVLGSRYMKGGGIPKNWGFHRKFLSVVGNLFLKSVMLNFRIHDWTSGYRAIRRSVVEAVVPQLNAQEFTGYTWQIGFLHKAVTAKFKIAEVPFKFIDRTIGHSKLGPEYIVNNLLYVVRVRTHDLFTNRIFKFIVVGGCGALVQFIALYAYRRTITYQLAFFLAIETSVVSNFIWSNLWTFADRKLKALEIPWKFVQFNLASAGSILIQQGIAFAGQYTIGLVPLFALHLAKFTLKVDTGMMYAVVGILIGMFWNFFAYSRLIWKKK